METNITESSIQKVKSFENDTYTVATWTENIVSWEDVMLQLHLQMQITRDEEWLELQFAAQTKTRRLR